MATYYVTQSAQGSGDGTSYANSASISTFNAGTAPFDDLADDTVYLCGAITTATIIPSGGTSGHIATIRGDYSGHACTINITAGNALSSASKDYLTIIGIAATTTGQYGYYANAGDYITVQDCILTGGSSGIYSNAVPHITVSNVTSNQTSVGTSYYGARFSGAGSNTLTINGLAVTSNGYGLRIANFTTQNISNVTVNNSGVRHALWFEMANSMTITGSNIAATCLGTNTGYAGICFEGNAAAGLDIDLSNITATGSAGHGVWFSETGTYTKIKIDTYNVSNNALVGIYLENTENVTLLNGKANYNNSDGINFNGGSGTAVITSCESSYNGIDGFSFANFANATLSKCKALSNGTRDETAAGDGFTAHTSCTGINIRYCLSAFNRNSGFAMVKDSAGAIYNCTGYANGDKTTTNLGVRGGFYCQSTAAWIVKNCSFSANYPYEVNCSAVSYAAATLDYNNYYHVGNGIVDENSAFTIDGGSTVIPWSTYHASYEVHSQYADPELISATDFHLRSSSPCINAGTYISGLTSDYDGNPLPPNGSGFVPDIGAYDSYVGSEGTVLCSVYLPWPTDTIEEQNLLTATNSLNSGISFHFGEICLWDGVNFAAVVPGVNAGYYAIAAQWSAILGRMRVGIFNPATGTLTWSHPTLGDGAIYRGFFPIYGSGSQQRLRWGYGLGGFPVGIGPFLWLNKATGGGALTDILQETYKITS